MDHQMAHAIKSNLWVNVEIKDLGFSRLIGGLRR